MKNGSAAPRVLLIEDETLVAGMLQSMLSTLGYSVVGTSFGFDEAMEMIKREDLEAVVLDINLDGRMSYPIADELTARGIPFIFSTGYGAGSLPHSYNDVPLLKKPFRRSALEGALADLLSEPSSSREAVGAR